MFHSNREMNFLAVTFGVVLYAHHVSSKVFSLTNAFGVSTSIDSVRRVIRQSALELRQQMADFKGKIFLTCRMN